jgi:trigger factor
MSLQIEKLEGNMAKLTIEVETPEVDKAIDAAYNKMKGKIAVPGFRKGKVPRKIIEKSYGKEVFYEEAVNIMIPDAYEKELNDCELDIVSQPDINVVKIEAGEPFVFTAMVALKPEVTLGKYKGIKTEKIDTSVTDEEVEAELGKVREQNSRLIPVEDRAVQDGDSVVIDFEGFVDGVPFDGGKAENHSLKIGSHSFIDTFEDQIIGHVLGDEFDVNVTFPEEYHAEELKGKPAVFKVKVNEIKVTELPELDDELAAEVSEFDTLEEYKADMKAKMQEKKEADAKAKKEDQVIEKIIEDAKMDIPAAMIDTQASSWLMILRIVWQARDSCGTVLPVYRHDSGCSLETDGRTGEKAY